MEQQARQSLNLEDRRHRSFGQVLACIWEKESSVQSLGLEGTQAWPKDYRSVPGLITSALLHISVVVLLVRLPVTLLSVRPNTANEHHSERLVYFLHRQDSAPFFPKVKPPGPGGKAGQGKRPDRPPARGSTTFHPTLTIISNPPRPDNRRQTIVQASSPPELKIPHELRLPNLLIGAVVPPPPAADVPKAPKIPVVAPPPHSAPLPLPPSLAHVLPPNPLPNPALTIPLPPPPAPPIQSSQARQATTLAELDIRRTPPGAIGLLSLSVEPAPPASSMTLPPGNRQGAFSIAPVAGQEGSPGGVTNGDAQGGGSGGNGPAGDASTGLGSADKGGGGGGAAPAAASPTEHFSISGEASGNKDDVLPSFLGVAEVYPVTPPPPRRPAMVVTAGPTGGGGLQVYGVLKGGKIYTIYLPMPGKRWILQYCAHENSATSQDRVPTRVVISLDPGIVPPSVVEQFDFRLPPASESTASRNEMIILQGVIREDGSVGELKVYKGLLGPLDRAAVDAFSRWKFRPALRSNKPIAVEILLGIPVILPAT